MAFKVRIDNVSGLKEGDAYLTSAYGIKVGDELDVIREFADRRTRSKNPPAQYYHINATHINPLLAGNWLNKKSVIRIEASKCTRI